MDHIPDFASRSAAPGGPGPVRRLAAAVLWLAAVLVSVAAALWGMARPSTPDAFYAAPHPAPEAGRLVRSEAYNRDVPAGARAWRILYGTTRGDGSPAVASAIVLIRGDAAGPRPVVAWAHGTTGLAPGCAPSVTMPFANVPALQPALDEGWGYVATDYVGLGTSGDHGYLVGDEAARGVLDSIRAARQLAEANLGERVVVWGHSQGGHSALWTGQRAGVLAPEVKVLGIAALAPASDLPALFAASRATMFGKIISSYLLEAYARRYPELRTEPLADRLPGLLARDIASRCVGGWQTLVSVAQTALLPSDGIFRGDPTAGPLGGRLRENTPVGPFPMPVLIAQGGSDDLVLPEIQSGYVRRICADGQAVSHREYAGRDHISLVAPGSPLEAEIVAWTRDRFAGAAAPRNCP